MRRVLCPALVLAWLVTAPPAFARGLASTDVLRMRSAGDVALSPEGSRLAYTVERSDLPGRPEKQLFVLTVADGRSVRVGGENDTGSGAWFSPDGRWLALKGKIDGKDGLHVARADGGAPRFLAEVQGTNSPLTHEGEPVAWSPDSKRIAYVSAVPGPETAAMTGDPVVITRYIYKPDLREGNTRFHDARRRHVFLVDRDGGAPRALTTGDHEEHSIDWSPDGAEIVCVSNREPDPDLFYNPDLFAVRVADGRLRRITATESAEYKPRFSPDGRTILFLGTRRGLTDLETTMEDTHVWTVAADGSGRRELGGSVDNRQYDAVFSPDGSSVYFTVQERGLVKVYRMPAAGGAADAVVSERGRVTSFALGPRGALAYTFTSDRDLAQVYYRPAASPARRLTDLNADVLAGVEIAPVEPFTFVSADFKWDVEAFLTKPLGLLPEGKHPLVVIIHGGPHGAQGPAFNFHSQFYAGRGYATLQVNYRGSTSYGQRFADAVFGDQNG